MKRIQFLKTIACIPFITAFKEHSPLKGNDSFIWTKEYLDKTGACSFIIKKNVDIYKDPGYASTVSWKLGFQISLKSLKKSADKYGKINFLTDGWFCPLANNYENLADYLNGDEGSVGYRPMTKEEVIYLINQRDQGFK